MSLILPIQTAMNVSDDRRRWTNSIVYLKKHFLEKIYNIFNIPIRLGNVFIPATIYDENEISIKEKLSYNGIVDLQWKLFGGYVYEYIFDEDLTNKNAYFSPTADIDFAVMIPDNYSTEFIVCDTNEMLKSSFYNGIYMTLLSRVTDLDFSEISYLLDELPPNDDDENNVDFGKIRFVCSDKMSSDNICQQKIQIYVSVNGYYNELVDIIIYFEMSNNKQKSDKIIKTGINLKEHEINYEPLDKLLNSELSALLTRLDDITDKTQNHVGRILYLLSKLSTYDNDILKYVIINTCNLFMVNLEKKYKCKINDLRNIVLLKYKGLDITVKELFRSISEYAIKRHNQRFVILYRND